MMAFAQDQLGVGDLQAAVKRSAGSPLNTVVWPQDLFAVSDIDRLERLPVGMRRRKR